MISAHYMWAQPTIYGSTIEKDIRGAIQVMPSTDMMWSITMERSSARIVTRDFSVLTLTIREAIYQEHQIQGVSMNERFELDSGGGIIRIQASKRG